MWTKAEPRDHGSKAYDATSMSVGNSNPYTSKVMIITEYCDAGTTRSAVPTESTGHSFVLDMSSVYQIRISLLHCLALLLSRNESITLPRLPFSSLPSNSMALGKQSNYGVQVYNWGGVCGTIWRMRCWTTASV